MLSKSNDKIGYVCIATYFSPSTSCERVNEGYEQSVPIQKCLEFEHYESMPKILWETVLASPRITNFDLSIRLFKIQLAFVHKQNLQVISASTSPIHNPPGSPSQRDRNERCPTSLYTNPRCKKFVVIRRHHRLPAFLDL